jgi:hypothetical protein
MRLMATLGLAFLMLAGAPRVTAGDGCDDIAKLADKWHAISNYIDKNSDDGKHAILVETDRVRAVGAEEGNFRDIAATRRASQDH